MAKTQSPPPYDHGWAWMIVAGSFIALFMSLGLIRSYGMILEEVIDKFDVPTALGVIPITIAGVVFAFLGPLFIVLSEVYTARKVVCFGSIVGVIGIALSSRLLNMPFFIVTFGVSFGIGASTLAGTGPLLISKYFIKRRSLATGLAMSGSSLGQFVMPLLIQYLLDEYALSGALLIMAGLFLQSMISSALYRPIESYDLTPPADVEEGQGDKSKEIDTNVDGNQTNDINKEDEPFLESQQQETWPSETGANSLPQTNGEAKTSHQAKHINEGTTNYSHDGEKAQMIGDSTKLAPEQPAPKKPKFSLKQVFDLSVLKRVDSVFIAVEAFFCFFGLMSFMLFLPGIIREKGFEDYENASLLSIMGIGDLIGRIGNGVVADLGFVQRYRIQSGSVFLAGVASGVCLFLYSYISLAVACCCFGLFSGGYTALFAPVVRDFVGPERMAKNFAVGLFLQGIGGATGQPLLGMIKDVTGSFSSVLVICCVSCLSGGSLLFCYPVFARLDQKLQNKKLELPVSD